jgi:C-terminal processing protease CtpA/Prc
MPKRDRRMVFIAFSGEERGLLGSIHYCKEPLFPLKNTAVMVNLDMVGRLSPDKESKKDRLIVYGTGTAKDFDALIEETNKKFDFKLHKLTTGTGPSDHASFYEKNIPVFFFFTDVHEDYHKPTDTADKINVPGMRKVTELTEEVLTSLLTRAERPEFVRVTSDESQPRPKRTREDMPRLGVRPSYSDDGEGVLLEGITDGGAGAKAGLKAGDRVMEIGGKPVPNLQGYMSVLAGQKKGQTVDVQLIRDGKKMTVKVTLE